MATASSSAIFLGLLARSLVTFMAASALLNKIKVE